MFAHYLKYWWAFLLRGVFALLFGIFALVWPLATIAALVLLFGAFVSIDGVLTVYHSFQLRKTEDRWWVLLLEGLAGIGIGLITFFYPQVTAALLVILVAVWAVATGIFELVAAIRLRKEIKGEWLLGLAGVMSIGLGIFFIAMPLAGSIVIAYWIGAYALIFGITLIALGFRMRKLHQQTIEQHA